MIRTRRRGGGGLSLLGLGLCFLFSASARSQVGEHRPPPAERHPTQIMVRFHGGVADAQVDRAVQMVPGARIVHQFRLVPDLTVVEIPDGDLEGAIARLQAEPAVQYAEPDFIVRTGVLPNDPGFGMQWGLHNVGQTVNGDPGTVGADVDAVTAWDFWVGSGDIRIAVIDSGIDLQHPDLIPNLWTNPGEIPGNGFDDDGNGYIDDVHGFDTSTNTGHPQDILGHGTHVAGIIAAAGDNALGVTGMIWSARLVAVKFIGPEGTGAMSDAIAAVDYAVANGIRISNNSWGCYECFSQSLYDTIWAAQAVGHVFIAAAGNGFLGLGVDTDLFPFYPASYDLPNIISVAATDNDDRRARFSNYGLLSVDLGAPGINIYTTQLGGDYAFGNGTSFAAPFVTGSVALLMDRRPAITAEEVVNRVRLTARPVAALDGLTVSGGILNAPGVVGDCNRNGTLDEEDILFGISADCNHNGIPDECEPDCNGNGIPDDCDVASGASEDCDNNGVPDECQPDCDGNGRADACDIADGLYADCNENGIPDVCEPGGNKDCNNNGIPDLCDIYAGISRDCNENGIPDECDLALGTSTDCAGNGVPDECERDCNENGVPDNCDILDGTSLDLDGDGIPDECFLGIALVPVSASTPHIVAGQSIQVVEGGSRVTLEIHLSGWDPLLSGSPRLRLYQAGINQEDLTSGNSGQLTLAEVPCENNTNCVAEAQCLPEGLCEPDGAFGIEELRPDFIFYGLDNINVSNHNIMILGSVLFFPADAVVDPGVALYGGTLMLDVPSDATGTFTIGFSAIDSWYGDEEAVEKTILRPALASAIIEILPDCNGNGIPDELDILSGFSNDCDGDGIPDECVEPERDCNGNGIPDVCDIAQGTSKDCNNNGIPDECIWLEDDCNGNGVPDECDIANGTSEDCNINNIPDECIILERDCNNNGVPDSCDVARGTSFDCNDNGIPDECEDDCNNNGLADECDIADGRSFDRDENGVPDECQRTLHVPAEYLTMQAAIQTAETGDIVLVAPGVYSGEGNTQVDFMGKGITVRCDGGPDDCFIDATGRQTGFEFVRAEPRIARLDGFTIANASNCGIAIFGGHPTIRNCIIAGNGPTSAGVLISQQAMPLFENCLITGNSANFDGGGMRILSSAPVIRRCTITGNSAQRGGGVYISGGAPQLFDTIIAGNTAITAGGGVAVVNASPRIENSTISGNRASSQSGGFGDGGGIWFSNSFTKLTGCVISGNHARRHGGGIYVGPGEPRMINCTVVGNSAQSNGGGLYWKGGTTLQRACCHSGFCEDRLSVDQCNALGGASYEGVTCGAVECFTQACCLPDRSCAHLSLFECLGAGGTPQEEGVQCLTAGCNPVVSNTIFWDNVAAVGSEIFRGTSIFSAGYSIVRGGWPGNHNSVGNPLFTIPGFRSGDVWVEGNYRVRTGSDAINTGTADLLPPDVLTDRDGHFRVLCGEVDRGAYEFGIGDFDCDQLVTLADFQQWPSCLTDASAAAYAAGCEAFDFNADGRVDLSDYAAFQNLTLFHKNNR